MVRVVGGGRKEEGGKGRPNNSPPEPKRSLTDAFQRCHGLSELHLFLLVVRFVLIGYSGVYVYV